MGWRVQKQGLALRAAVVEYEKDRGIIYLSVIVRLFVGQSVCLSAYTCLSACLVYLSVCVAPCLSIQVCLLVCLPISVFISVCLSASPSLPTHTSWSVVQMVYHIGSLIHGPKINILFQPAN